MLADFRGAEFLANRSWYQTTFDKEDIGNICFDLDVDIEYLRDIREIDVGSNESACFFADKDVRWDILEEQLDTIASSSWKLWRDGKCSFHGPSLDDEFCYGKRLH